MCRLPYLYQVNPPRNQFTQKDFFGDEVPLVPGTLRVYRSWLPSVDGWLEAINFPYLWGPGVNQACCMGRKGTGNNITPASQVPARDCTCGFYATYTPELTSLGINGVIEVSGKVILGTRGVRAKRARIVAVAMNPVTMLRYTGFVEHYPDVTCFDTVCQLLEAFPPQDVSELIGKPEPEPKPELKPGQWVRYTGRPTFPNG